MESLRLIDGKTYSKTILKEIKDMSSITNINSLEETELLEIKVVFIQIGNNHASNLYVKNKIKACEECGFKHSLFLLEEGTTEDELLETINILNKLSNVHGIMVQLPLPGHIDEKVIRNSINPKKDIDGFHSINLGKTLLGESDAIIPATPLGITLLIDEYGIETEGKHIVVLGRSETVGRPIANILSNNKYNATVTMCHSKTKDLEFYTRHADIIISAMGKANFITGDMVKEGVSIIDVGINRDENGKLCGDCEFSTVSEKASYITPVPGGVGPMTVASLMYNLTECYINLMA